MTEELVEILGETCRLIIPSPCPQCGQSAKDQLIWEDNDWYGCDPGSVICGTCDCVYQEPEWLTPADVEELSQECN